MSIPRSDRVQMIHAEVQDMLKRGGVADETKKMGEEVAARATSMSEGNAQFTVTLREGKKRAQVRVLPATDAAWQETLRNNLLLKAVDSL